MFIVDALYDSQQGDVIVIDEPELSLHPSLQKKLFSLLADFAKDRQIVYATHSPYFIDWESVLNGAHVVRVHKPTTRTVLSTLSLATVSRIRGLLEDANNPHVLGLDAREVFFLEDGVILVEGQDDVLGYKRIAAQLQTNIKGNFFGWGVGGAEKMSIIAGMLADLGFQRVVGILDKNKNEVRAALEVAYPAFKFLVIPSDDVRTKRGTPPKQAVFGLLDDNAHLRPEYRAEMVQLLNDVNAALA